MTDPEQVKLQLEAWKKVIDVQQNFNEIEFKIRNMLVTILGGLFSVVGYFVRDKLGSSTAAKPDFSIELILLGVGFFVVVAFWMMDRYWYHRYLVGAVLQAQELETLLEPAIPGIALTGSISRNSPIYFAGRIVRSKNKIDFLYGTFATIVLACVAVLVVKTFGVVIGLVFAAIFLSAWTAWLLNLERGVDPRGDAMKASLTT